MHETKHNNSVKGRHTVHFSSTIVPRRFSNM